MHDELQIKMMKLTKLSMVDFLQNVRKHHSSILGEKTRLTDLNNLILGYSCNTTKEGNPPFLYFNVWVKQKFNKWGANMHWTKAILQECKNDEEKAFWHFFELLDQFTQLKPLNIYSCNLSEDNFAHYYSKDTRKNSRLIGPEGTPIIHPAPYHIKAVEFDYCIHSYHFDFNYVVSESEFGWHDLSFFSLEKCFEYYTSRYDKLIWNEIPKKTISSEFDLIVENCNHKNANHHYIK